MYLLQGHMLISGILRFQWWSLQSLACKFIYGPAHFAVPVVICSHCREVPFGLYSLWLLRTPANLLRLSKINRIGKASVCGLSRHHINFTVNVKLI